MLRENNKYKTNITLNYESFHQKIITELEPIQYKKLYSNYGPMHRHRTSL